MKESRRDLIIAIGILAAALLLAPETIYAQEISDNSREFLAAQPVAEQEDGELLYSDDFSSSKSGWPTYTQGGILTSYKDGKYHVTISPPNYWEGVNAPRVNLTDFVMEVEATKEAGPDDNVYGLFVRNTKSGSFYAFLISSDGYFDYARKENGTWATQSNWTKSSAIMTGNGTNLIRLESKADRFAFYANGEKLGEYTDNSFAYGGIGLWTGSQSEGNVTIGFDNLNIRAMKEE